MPRLVVIMPVRDGMPHLHSALTSTLRALPRDALLAVYDDGSDDGTRDYLRRCVEAKPSRLHVVEGAAPVGVARALNTLLSETDSEVVARMDADDICLPWRFALQLRQVRNWDGLLFSCVGEVGEQGRLKRLRAPIALSPLAVAVDLLTGNNLVHPTMIGRRTVLQDIGGYRDVGAEDYDLWLRAVAEGVPLRRSAAVTLGYRRHEGQATRSVMAQSWFIDPGLRESYLAALARLLPDEPALRREIFARRFEPRHAETSALGNDGRRSLRNLLSQAPLIQRAVVGRHLQSRFFS